MSLSENEYELIEKFLTDSLSEEDRNELKERLKNEAFRKEIEFQAGLNDALNEAEDRKIKELLQQKQTHGLQKSGESRSFRMLFKYAAALALVLSAWFGFKHLSFNQQLKNIVAEHNVSYPPEKFERGQSDQISGRYKEAMGYYANQNYELAYNIFLDLNPQTERIILYRANCLLELGNQEAAKSLLLSIQNSNDPEIKQNAEWYLAIAHLLEKKPGDSKKILRSIANNTDHLFGEKAKKLLRSL